MPSTLIPCIEFYAIDLTVAEMTPGLRQDQLSARVFPSYMHLLLRMTVTMTVGMMSVMGMMMTPNRTITPIGMMILGMLVAWTHSQIKAFSPPLALLRRSPPPLPWWCRGQ